MTTDQTGLIVPVDVLAHCVGTLDAHGPARKFAGATTDFSNQTTAQRPAFLGLNVSRAFDQAPLWPLEAGVHLHWAMPDALTRAADTDDRTFPPLPNRWLVTRVVGNAHSKRHWIIESDTLGTAPPNGNPAPTVPVQEPAAARHGAAPQRGFRYLGVRHVLDASWREPHPTAALTLKAATNYELHAVATGDIAFAAFYPNARSVFGFHDDLTDLPAGPVELMYVVTGWYSVSGNDPVAGLVQTQLETKLGWTLATASPATFTYSLYSGLVQGIAWDPATRYLTDDPEPIAGDVAVGNHPAEALAAYFRGRNYPQLPAFEELLTLYLTGLLPNLGSPQAGQLALLDEALHELQFSGVDGGTIYSVTRDNAEARDLPLPLADALNALNRLQQAADMALVQARQARWQVFAAWYRLFQVDPSAQNAAFAAFTAQLELQPAIAAQQQATAAAAATQHTAVTGMLTSDLSLVPTPGPRYYTPTEPVVMLAGDAAAPATRHGGDGRFHPAGFLVCRRDSDLLQELTIAPSTALTAAHYAALLPAAPNQLPYAAIGALIAEAAMLDPAIGAAASGVAEATLAADLVTWLEGGTAQYHVRPTGTPPSPIEVNAWGGANPWCSLMMLWELDYHPLLTTSGARGPVDYPASFFTANYAVDPDQPRQIAYSPTGSGIAIDPSAIDFDPSNPRSGTQRYQGASILSLTAADNLRAQLAKYLAKLPDATLQTISDQLAAVDISMQALTGLNDALVTRAQSLQLSIGVSPTAPLPFRQATAQAMSVIPSLREIAPLAPQFNGAFNALRAGYAQLSLQVMDPFGRKRPVQIKNLYLADGLGASASGKPAPGVIFAQPRLAEPSRLLFRWLAADTTEDDEMNAHPATTPVCGWLLPNHLAVGFFLYDGQGNPLGSLTRRADRKGIVWQATPGNQGTIGADLPTVMAHQNPHLREVALALGAATPTWFTAFWKAADTAITQIAPAAPSSQSGLAALVGRPLAIVQASMRLERRGLAAFDQSFATLSGGQFPDTDHGLGGVQLPVVLGDLKRLDDGLVGYWKPAASGRGYNIARFYTQAADGEDPGVASPSPTNLLLTPAATPETTPDAPRTETKLLLLVDPRAAVHATMGILPTQALSIPADQYEDTLAGLELTFAANPLLRPAGALAIPLPAIAGFNWSWITEDKDPSGGAGSTSWTVDPELGAPTAGAVWQYSPQTATEGWLRLNPELLRFRLTNSAGAAVVTAGTTVSLSLTITNARAMPITFSPAPSLVGETSAKQGSLFYVHFGALVTPAQVGSIQLAAPGWQFQALTDAHYGTYWAASPSGAPVTLKPGDTLPISLTNVPIAAGGSLVQARIYFDYYGVTGGDDGIDIAVISVQQPAAVPVA